jgi:uncharacterized protein with NRDE domain
MCILFLAYKTDPAYPLILAANRDEFYNRPSAPAGFWQDAPDIYGGRDLVAGGTWLGVNRSGQFAAVTNYREPGAAPGPRSRGDLVADFLRSGISAAAYVESILPTADQFSGFNLIAGNIGSDSEVVYYSNRGGPPRKLGAGIYGLSNHLLDSPWPKVSRGKAELASLFQRRGVTDEALFQILQDRTMADENELPSTGLPIDRERALSPIFIATPDYRTRCSTVVRFDNNFDWKFEERVFV